MKKTVKILLPILLTVIACALGFWLLQSSNIAVLNPKGTIAAEQLELLIFVTLLMLTIVIPVLVLTFFIAWKYRESNKKAVYRPEWDGSGKLEAAWWGIPFIIIAVLSVVIWSSSYALDPYKPIASNKRPLAVQAVALQWKWLFLYPEENIATVNYLKLPKDRPIEIANSADAPMSSLWIPQLGGQIYAMNGMATKLHLQATETGTYYGASANINGKGFASMNFDTEVVEESDFESWVAHMENEPKYLSFEAYEELAEPSEKVKPISYGSFQHGLYDRIIMKFMMPDMKGDEHEVGEKTHTDAEAQPHSHAHERAY